MWRFCSVHGLNDRNARRRSRGFESELFVAQFFRTSALRVSLLFGFGTRGVTGIKVVAGIKVVTVIRAVTVIRGVVVATVTGAVAVVFEWRLVRRGSGGSSFKVRIRRSASWSMSSGAVSSDRSIVKLKRIEVNWFF